MGLILQKHGTTKKIAIFETMAEHFETFRQSLDHLKSGLFRQVKNWSCAQQVLKCQNLFKIDIFKYILLIHIKNI